MNCFCLCKTTVESEIDYNGYLVSIECPLGRSYTDLLTFSKNTQSIQHESLVKYAYESLSADLEYSNCNSTKNEASLSPGTLLWKTEKKRISYNTFEDNKGTFTLLYITHNVNTVQFKYQNFLRNTFGSRLTYYVKCESDIECYFCSFWRNKRLADFETYLFKEFIVFVHDCTFSDEPKVEGEEINIQNYSIRLPFGAIGNAFETGLCFPFAGKPCTFPSKMNKIKLTISMLIYLNVEVP